MKKLLIIAISVVGTLGICVAGIIMHANHTIHIIAMEFDRLAEVSTSDLTDGVYNGRCGSLPVYVDLDVTVRNGAIAKLDIKKQLSGPGYDDRAILTRIVQAQSPKVDVVAGATTSSKCIMIAATRALAKARKEPIPNN
jgi:uncharacterized protein with FMN-binding domain